MPAPAIVALLGDALLGVPNQGRLWSAHGVTSLAGTTRKAFVDALSEVACRESGHWRPQTWPRCAGVFGSFPG